MKPFLASTWLLSTICFCTIMINMTEIFILDAVPKILNLTNQKLNSDNKNLFSTLCFYVELENNNPRTFEYYQSYNTKFNENLLKINLNNCFKLFIEVIFLGSFIMNFFGFKCFKSNCFFVYSILQIIFVFIVQIILSILYFFHFKGLFPNYYSAKILCPLLANPIYESFHQFYFSFSIANFVLLGFKLIFVVMLVINKIKIRNVLRKRESKDKIMEMEMTSIN